MFKRSLCAVIKPLVNVPVFLQGSVTDTELVSKLRHGLTERIRPCILCNQTSQVRDMRNPRDGT